MNIYTTDSMTCITPGALIHAIDKDKDTVFIVPEPAKAQVERLVVRDLIGRSPGSDAAIRGNTKNIPVVASFVNGDVVSFMRLSERILRASGAVIPSAGNDIILRNAVYSVLASHHDEFRTFDSLTGRADNIIKLISLLGDFARYGIDQTEIGKAIDAIGSDDGNEVSALYRDKLCDIRLLMEYLDEMNAKYSLGLLYDPIAVAASTLDKTDSSMLKNRRYRQLRTLLNRRFAIVQFGVTRNFTPGEYAFVEALDRLSCGVDLYLNGMSGDTPAGKCSSAVIDRLGRLPGCNVEKFEINDLQSNDLSKITRDYSEGKLESSSVTGSEDIVLAEISGTDNVLGYVLDEVMKLTREHGYRYRDIRICCCDEELRKRIRSVASGFGLDVFIDRRIELNNTAVPGFVQSLLKLPLSGFALGDVLTVLRSGMIRVHPGYCDVFENYCVAKNITDSTRMFSEQWYLDDTDHPMLMNVEPVASFGYDQEICRAGRFLYRNIVQRHLIPLRDTALRIYGKKDIASKAELILEYLDEIRDYIAALRDELLDAGRSDAAEAMIRAYDETMALLAAFTHEMNRVEISQRNFLELFRTDMMNKTSGTIPLKVDSIEITSPEHAYYTPCKVMFLIGARRDNYPYSKTVDGIMSGDELARLADNISVNLPDKTQVRSREEFITSSLIFGAVTDRFYMVHSQSESKSRIYEALWDRTSPDCRLMNVYQTPVEGKRIKPRYSFTDAAISPELISILLDDDIKMSVTAVERFMNCHAEFMLDKVLRIRQREDRREIQANVFGSLAHKMFEIALKETCDKYNTPELLAERASMLESDPVLLDSVTRDVIRRSFAEENVAGTLDENGDVVRVSDNNHGNKLRRLFRFMFPAILRECADTRFIPADYEMRIGDDPYPVSYDINGKKFRFTGFVDRYDVSYDDPSSFRIQDYKTFVKEYDPLKLLAGIQIQLPVYANAVMTGKEGSFPADIGYSPISIKAEKGKGSLEFKTLNAGITHEQMETVLKYTDYIIRKALSDIAAGKADALYCSTDSSSAKYHTLVGLLGNPQSKPVCRPDDVTCSKKEVYDVMKKIMEEGDNKDE